jgi:DNA-binding response OmpR family regulator
MQPPPKRTILVVDDEVNIVLGLRDALEFEGFRVVSAHRGLEGVELAKKEKPDAVLLDLMLPDANGYQVCAQLRAFDRRVPILMITARSQEVDKLRGFDAGADDYVTKPFSVNELIARLRAMVRRAEWQPHAPEETVVGEATVNFGAQTCRRGGGEEQLSFYEVEVLRLLVEKQGQVVARDDILQRVWGLENVATNRTVDNVIVKLRKKVEPVPERPVHIRTVYGVGYKLV